MTQNTYSLSDITEFLIKYKECNDELKARIETIEKTLNGYSNMDALEAAIAKVERDVQDRDQYMMANDIQISGIPETVGEHITQIVLRVAPEFGVSLNECDIASTTRVGRPRKSVQGPQKTSHPRPIVVRFVRRAVRDDMLMGGRIRRGTTTSADIGFDGPTFMIYINERLTAHNRLLMRKARAMARLAQWRYVWSRYGKIYARRGNGEEHYEIRSEADIEWVFGCDQHFDFGDATSVPQE